MSAESGGDTAHPGAPIWDNSLTTKGALSQRELTQGDDHSRLRTSDRMASMPAEDSTVTLPPDSLIEAMSRVDRCPDCVENLEPPYRVELRPLGYVAFYGCSVPTCGYFWHTDWRL